jgi:hypothetical protein
LLRGQDLIGDAGLFGSGALAAFGQDLKLLPTGETQVPISQWLENRHSACSDLRPQCQKCGVSLENPLMHQNPGTGVDA